MAACVACYEGDKAFRTYELDLVGASREVEAQARMEKQGTLFMTEAKLRSDAADVERSRAALEYCRSMRIKYDRAARFPFLPVPPDPPDPQ